MKPFVPTKLFAILLLLTIMLTFVACNGGEVDSENSPTQDNSTNNNNKNDDDTTNNNEIENGDNTTEAKIILKALSNASSFSSGIANISVSVEVSMPDGQGGYKNPDSKVYNLVIDTDGTVLYFDHKGTYHNNVCIDGSVVYDKSGNAIISPELQGFDSIINNVDTKPTDVGLFLVKKVEHSLSGNKTLYGVLNTEGNWTVTLSEAHPLLNIENLNDERIGYVGNGIYEVETVVDSFYINTVYYNAVTNQVTQGYDHFAFKDYDNGSDFCESLLKYSADGSVECIVFDCCGIVGEDYILVKKNDGSKTSLIDMNGNEIINLGEYNIGMNRNYEYKNGYFLCTAVNPDFDMYWCLFDSSGNLAFAPTRIENEYDEKYCLSDEGVIYQKGRNEVYFYDYEGNSTKLEGICEIEGTSFADGFLSVHTMSNEGYCSCYIDANGEIALDLKSIENAVIKAIRDQFLKEQE